jgi:hypothetical protein
MEEARSLKADDLAPADFQQAQKAFARAQAVAKEGNADTAKVLFVSAKIYFNKSAVIARGKRDALSRELRGIQIQIKRNFNEMQNDISRSDLPARLQGQVRAIASEVEKENASITTLVDQEDFVKAIATAKDVQTKIYNAQLILARQSPK